MFGSAYFGKTYWGGTYWGPAGGDLPPPPVIFDQSFGWINRGRQDELAKRWKERQAEIDRILDNQPSFLEHLADLERRTAAEEQRRAEAAAALASLTPLADAPLAEAVVKAAADEEETEEMLIFLLV